MADGTMNLRQWRDTGDYLEHAGHRIFYRVEGEGCPLLLIHGYPTASWDWCKIWDVLREYFRVITLDMIGFGFSDKPESLDYTIHTQADIYEALLKHLSINEMSHGHTIS